MSVAHRGRARIHPRFRTAPERVEGRSPAPPSVLACLVCHLLLSYTLPANTYLIPLIPCLSKYIYIHIYDLFISFFFFFSPFLLSFNSTLRIFTLLPLLRRLPPPPFFFFFLHNGFGMHAFHSSYYRIIYVSLFMIYLYRYIYFFFFFFFTHPLAPTPVRWPSFRTFPNCRLHISIAPPPLVGAPAGLSPRP